MGWTDRKPPPGSLRADRDQQRPGSSRQRVEAVLAELRRREPNRTRPGEPAPPRSGSPTSVAGSVRM
jgi:hypothetical protein